MYLERQASLQNTSVINCTIGITDPKNVSVRLHDWFDSSEVRFAQKVGSITLAIVWIRTRRTRLSEPRFATFSSFSQAQLYRTNKQAKVNTSRINILTLRLKYGRADSCSLFASCSQMKILVLSYHGMQTIFMLSPAMYIE